MKKLSKVILHIGPDKTGSTAIQNALFTNRDYLLSKGIIYSSGDYLNDKLLRNHFLKSVRLADTYKNNNQILIESYALNTNYIKRLKSEIESRAANELVLSHEGLIHLEQDEMTALRDFLMNYTDCIKVVIYIRDPVSYAASAMSQRVQSGRRSLDDIIPPYLRYKDYLSSLSQVFGKDQINLRIYSRTLFPKGDVVRDFLELFELDVNEKELIATNSQFKGNPSLSFMALLVGDRIVQLLGKNVPNSQEFNKLFVPELFKINGEKIKLSRIQFILLKIKTYKHLKYIHQAFGFKLGMKNFFFAHQHFTLYKKKKEIDILASNLIDQLMPDIDYGLKQPKQLLLRSMIKTINALLK